MVKQREALAEPLPDLTGESAEFGGYTAAGAEADRKAIEDAVKKEMYSRDNAKNYKRAAPGVRVRFDKGTKQFEVRRRAYSPTLVNLASMLPAAAAINTGIGLMGSEDNGSITGRQAGYTAAVPDELDPESQPTPSLRWECGICLVEAKIMDASDFFSKGQT